VHSTSLSDEVIEIAAKVASCGRYVMFQLADIAAQMCMFADILRLIARLRAPLWTA